MDTKQPIKVGDNILTPVDMPTLPLDKEITNYQVQELQRNMLKSIQPQISDIPLRNQNEQVENLLSQQNEIISDLKLELENSYIQLKQANDKISAQTSRIVKLETELKEERKHNHKSENKISIKDWKLWAFTLIGAGIMLFIEYFILPLIT